MHLIIAKYENDAERKRIEYILDKWKESLRVTKPDGIMAIIEGEGLEELLEDLYSRTSRSNVSLYRLEHESVQIERAESEIRLKLNEKRDSVERLVGFVMAKQKAILKRETKDPLEKVYEVITKKGRAEVSVGLLTEGQTVSLRVKITGYGDVVELLNNRLSEEFSYLGGK